MGSIDSTLDFPFQRVLSTSAFVLPQAASKTDEGREFEFLEGVIDTTLHFFASKGVRD